MSVDLREPRRAPEPARAPQPARARRALTFNGRAMGSPLRIVAVTAADEASIQIAAGAWVAVRDEFEAVEQAMSRFRDGSEITIANRTARRRPVLASQRLWQALVTCDRARRVTEGRFDPRVLADLERLGDRGAPVGVDRLPGHEPDPRLRIIEVAAPRLVRLPVPIDLGGIGKGLALRWAAAILRRHGLEAFILEAGGDLVVAGGPPQGGSWQIGIEDPLGGEEPLAVIAASDAAIATSSVRRRRWTSHGRTVHHLLDPRTGEPGGAGLLAVTVLGRDAAWSEVWTKALFLEGARGVAALARRQGLAAWWVAEDGHLEMTPAARVQTIRVRAEAA